MSEVGGIVKAREHLPLSHYHAVSSCETEGILGERKQDFSHPPGLDQNDTLTNLNAEPADP